VTAALMGEHADAAVRAVQRILAGQYALRDDAEDLPRKVARTVLDVGPEAPREGNERAHAAYHAERFEAAAALCLMGAALARERVAALEQASDDEET
jgi:hypothetical protein